jgi:uncharacterized protein DUF1573
MNHLPFPVLRLFLAAIAVIALYTATLRADLDFVSTEVDVGEVRAGAPLSHTFLFQNRGTESVEVTGIQSTCGCLTSRLTRKRYEPGERGSLEVAINTLSPVPGPHTWQVTLSCKSEEKVVETPLRVKAKIVREIIVEPAAVSMFVVGPIQNEIRLTDLRSQPLTLTAVTTSATWLEAGLAGREHDNSNHLTQVVHLRVTEDVPEGTHEEALSIFTNDPAYPEIRVPVSVVKRPRQRVTATPSRVDLTADAGSLFLTRTILIRDRENQDVIVETVSSESPAVNCQWAKGPGAMTTVKIRVDASAIPEKNWKTILRIQVAKPVPETLLIPVNVSLP